MANSASRPILDITQEYSAVKTAILDILGGAQSASLNSGSGSTSFTKADMATLRQMERDLWDELVAANDEATYGTTGLSTMRFTRLY